MNEEATITKISLRFILNGEEKRTECVPADNLIDTLRETYGTMSVKKGCDFGGCGMCTILLDGKPVYSCMTPAWRVTGRRVETLEGLKKKGQPASLDPLQEAFATNFAQQCGYCTPAMIMSAKALLSKKPNPSVEQIKDAISGVLCRCTGYVPIVEAITQAANAQAKNR